jgi:hypothetical protein
MIEYKFNANMLFFLLKKNFLGGMILLLKFMIKMNVAYNPR